MKFFCIKDKNNLQNFRISPQNTVDGEKIYARGKSAQESHSRRYREEPDDTLPDPLEPWSTRNLANINKILGQK